MEPPVDAPPPASGGRVQAPSLAFPLETERLLIRPWEPTDVDPFHRLYASREVMRWVGGGPSHDIDHSERRLQWLIEQHDQNGLSLWALVERESGTVIGDCGLILVAGEGPEVEVAYKLARSYWGHGFATEAARAVVECGVRELGLPRIVAYAFPENIASQRVLEKLGMTRLGLRTEYGHELLYYAMESPLA